MIQGGDFDKGNVGALLILNYMLIVCGLYLVKSVDLKSKSSEISYFIVFYKFNLTIVLY